jgi:hypothetical protein
MDIRRKFYFSSERYKAAGNAGAVRLLNLELKVGSFHRIRDFFAQFRKELGDYVVPGKSLPVLCFEEFFTNNAVGVDEEIPRPRHSFKLTDGFTVENFIGPNGFGVGVGE